MFVVNYADGRSAYLMVAPQEIGLGDFLARSIATDRQASGEIPAGRIVAVRRVRSRRPVECPLLRVSRDALKV
jgi:hypothetical protein